MKKIAIFVGFLIIVLVTMMIISDRLSARRVAVPSISSEVQVTAPKETTKVVVNATNAGTTNVVRRAKGFVINATVEKQSK